MCQSFTSAEKLAHHKKVKLAREEAKMFNVKHCCPKCPGKEFELKASLNQHLRRKHAPGMRSCDHCKKTDILKNQLADIISQLSEVSGQPCTN